MKNMTTIKVPKKYEGMLELIEKDSEGYWAYAKEGFEFEDMQCRTAHEYTQADLLKVIRSLRKDETFEEVVEEEIVEEVVVEEAAIIEPTDTIRKAGKKFKYEVTFEDGRTKVVTSNKDTYTHFVISTNIHGKQQLMSKHSRRDLAEQRIAEDLGWDWCKSAIIVETSFE